MTPKRTARTPNRTPKGSAACSLCSGTGVVESVSGKKFVCGDCTGTGRR